MSGANGDNLDCLVRFSDNWHRLALRKMRQLQDDGMTCAEIVLEHPSKGTAHIDRWGKVTWDDEPNAELSGGEAVRSDDLFGVSDPCKTCSDRDKAGDDEPCASCGPPAWEYHDCRCEDDDTPNAGGEH